jgi:hypothetical protein
MFPTACKTAEVTDTLLERLEARQRALLAHRVGTDARMCLVMDNCIPDLINLKWDKGNKAVQFLFQVGKEFGVSTLITSNFPPKMPDWFSSAIDYVFILKDNNKVHNRALWQRYGGMFSTADKFSAVVDKATNNFGCLVIDRTRVTDNVSDCVFFCRAPASIPRYYLGSPNLWRATLANRKLTLPELLNRPMLPITGSTRGGESSSAGARETRRSPSPRYSRGETSSPRRRQTSRSP